MCDTCLQNMEKADKKIENLQTNLATKCSKANKLEISVKQKMFEVANTLKKLQVKLLIDGMKKEMLEQGKMVKDLAAKLCSSEKKNAAFQQSMMTLLRKTSTQIVTSISVWGNSTLRR